MQITINTNPKGAIVRNQNFDILGRTPITILKEEYVGQFIIINYGIESKKISITDDLDQINLNFEQEVPVIKTPELPKEDEIKEDEVFVENDSIPEEKPKKSFKKMRPFLIGFVLLLIGLGGNYLLDKLASKPNLVNIEQQISSKQFLELTNEEKIKHYLFFEDRRDHHYLKTLLNLSNLHFWDVDNIAESLLDKAYRNDSNRISNSKNEVLSIIKENELYKVDVKYTYTNSSNEQKEKYPKIYFGFAENGLINYIDNKPRN
ncbi:hypothetical protein [Empedobacter sp.]|uniref:hypothetical protein n=1 Tax=Empedobacter sp. TaxID=1927715 RepID=UPI0028B19CD3|nr:hypothetical protein [Empedobacter sp.]